MTELFGKITIHRLHGQARTTATEVTVSLQNKTVTPTAAEQVIEAAENFDGLGVVTVVGDSNFIAKNIRNGVKIWGVMGTGVTPPFTGAAVGVISSAHRERARTELIFTGLFETSATGVVV